jgi:DNA end-binding protein Ku
VAERPSFSGDFIMIQTLPAPTSPAPAIGSAPGGRPSWSGLLQLSLVGIPLKAYPAVRSHETSHFHQYHAGCGQRIRYAKQCPVHGPVAAEAIVKGYEYGPGQHVVVEPEELDALRPVQDKALRLERFLEPAHFDPLLFSGRSLHLVPDGPAASHAYDVLRTAMSQRSRWALGRIVLGGHQQVVLVRPAAALLVLHVLHFPELLRAAARPDQPRPCQAGAELDLAGQLIDAAGGAIDWASYRDASAQELQALIEVKLRGQAATQAEPVPRVLPLLEALQKSLAGTPVAPPAPPREEVKPRKRSRRTA